MSGITEENPLFLTEQIITYIGNKRSLLDFIGAAVEKVKEELGKERLFSADIFSGSGIVSRFLKKHSELLYSNDLEKYCETINRCYLSNREEINMTALEKHHAEIRAELAGSPLRKGFITELYCPEDDQNIKPGERVFYTKRNGMFIDTARQLIEQAPNGLKPYLLAPLIYEASVHNNTSGVFKGFYKNSKTGIGQYGGNGRNALSRIMSDIELKLPVFSNFSCRTEVLREDAVELTGKLPHVDLVYMDPPYNQHPYGSNYFMLNLINDYKRPGEISRVSGIPVGWNKSQFNTKQTAGESMKAICENLDASYLLISFNNEGFISRDEMTGMLSEIGEVMVFDKKYNTFRGSRNLNGRDIHVKEFLYLVKKNI